MSAGHVGTAWGFDEFKEAGTLVLREISARVPDVIASAASVTGVWHPNGFAIWSLRELPGLGTLRLHVWPDRHRRVRDWGPRIHAHGWHLASMVLAGTYSDRVYQVVEVPGRTMTIYEIFHTGGGRSKVSPTGERVTIERVATRVVKPGELHYLPHSVVHETVVPDTEYVATLVVMGEVIVDRSVALEEQEHPARDHQRAQVSRQESDYILEQLASLTTNGTSG